MKTTTNFGLQTYESDDIVNVMTVDKGNMETIDTQMKSNQLSGVGDATELLSGTVHAITRSVADCPMFRFTATSNYTAGDTFVVDGVQVTALLPSGEALGSGSYIIGSEVLCALRDTLMTVYVSSGVVSVAQDSEKLGGELPEYYATATAATEAQATATAAGVLAQSNTQQISGLDTRVQALETKGEVYNIGVEEAIGTLGDKTVYRKRYKADNVSIVGNYIIDNSLTPNTVDAVMLIDGSVAISDGFLPVGYHSNVNYYILSNIGLDGLRVYSAGFTVLSYFIEIIYTKV
jgi:hypothetical protein